MRQSKLDESDAVEQLTTRWNAQNEDLKTTDLVQRGQTGVRGRSTRSGRIAGAAAEAASQV